jgi:glycogen debranching enzyme
MEDIIRVNDQFYILASSSPADELRRVLKQGDTFAVFDHFGNIRPVGLGEQGLYHEGTRHLSRLELLIDNRRPLLLSSTVREDNALVVVSVTNPDFHHDGQVVLPRDSIHILRSAFLSDGTCYARFRVQNFALHPVTVSWSLRFEADFADIFEVRGMKRPRRGRLLQPDTSGGAALLEYEGLDGTVRRTRLEFDPAPHTLTNSVARFEDTIGPKQEQTYVVTITCESSERTQPPRSRSFDLALNDTVDERAHARARDAAIFTSNEQFNDWVNRSQADLHMMMTKTPAGSYPYAGVPWFSTVFGRDGIITALEYLWVNPEPARGVLLYLAAHQARETDAEKDAEPGKILHETRKGEMAALGEIPFGRYYGSVDATPLFVMLAGAYYERTADRELIESIWPNIGRALEWIDRYGDADGDGFIEYSRHSTKGLGNQGWKDSIDSVFHANGKLAEAPIALCEVQGYVYAARRAAADLAAMLGNTELAEHLRAQAGEIQRRFEEAFWCEDLATYALALDGNKEPCRIRTSNAGHCLFTGIARPDRAERVAATLMDDTSFSGWGIRTVATTEVRFNPISYHNGSVWPHDNALIAAGFARYEMKHLALKLLTGLFDASLFVDLHRMPELFCGFIRHEGEGPTRYPVACTPQSWAAAAPFLLLQSCLGLSIDTERAQIRFTRPVLPPSLKRLKLRNLRLGGVSVDLSIHRHARDVGINLLQRDGNVEIAVVK